MTPPGLAFVAADERARTVHKSAGLRTLYWDWTSREGEIHYQKYCGTPPEHLLFGLRKAIDMLQGGGPATASSAGTRLLAEATRRAVAKWAEGQVLELQHRRPAERANSVTTVLMQGRDPEPLRDYCQQQCGVVLGIGIGELGGKAFRIGHMGHVNAPMVLGTLGAVEMALAALGIPHGRGGVQAAVEYLGRRGGGVVGLGHPGPCAGISVRPTPERADDEIAGDPRD